MSASINESILEYSQLILKASDELTTKFSLGQIEKEPIFDSPATKDVLFNLKLTSEDKEAFAVDVTSFLNAAFTQSLYEVMESHLGHKKDSLQENKAGDDRYLHKLLCILDLSIATSRHHGADSCPMNVFSTIMLICCSSDFAVRRFGEVFFSEESLSRRLALTLNNSLVGKAKPGSTLLQLGNSLIPKLYDQFEENNTFTARLHLFIQSALEIDDKLSLSSDWAVNKHHGLYQGLVGSRNWPTVPLKAMPSPYHRIFVDYGKLMEWFTSQDIEGCLKMISEVAKKGARGSVRGRDLATDKLYDFESSIKWIRQDIEKIIHPDMNIGQNLRRNEEYLKYKGQSKQCDWVLNQEEFGLQLRDDNKNMFAFVGQLVILLDYISRFCSSHIRVVMDKLARRKLKFKRPAVYDSAIESVYLYKQMQHFKMQILQALDEHESLIVSHILGYTEDTWELMKLQQFNHPDLEVLKQHSASKKRKLDEYMQDCEKNTFKKRKPYFHKLGTARLSRVWRTETGLDNLKKSLKNKEETLEGYKDDIYMAEGSLEEKKGQLKRLEKEREGMEKEKKQLEEEEKKQLERKEKEKKEEEQNKEERKEKEKKDEDKKDEPKTNEDKTNEVKKGKDKTNEDKENEDKDNEDKKDRNELKEENRLDKMEETEETKDGNKVKDTDNLGEEKDVEMPQAFDHQMYQNQIDDIAQLKKEIQKDTREDNLLRWKMLRVSRSSGVWSDFRL